MMGAWSRRVEDASRILLRSFGALFFASGSASGLLFLVVIAAVNRPAAAVAVAGALAANLAAGLLRGERSLLEAGIYGFNGVLAGFGSLYFIPPDSTLSHEVSLSGATVALAVVAGAASGAIVRLYFRLGWNDRPGLPVTTLPSVLAVWCAGKLFVAAGLLTLSADALFPPWVEIRWQGLGGREALLAVWREGSWAELGLLLLGVLAYAVETPRRVVPAAAALVLGLVVGGTLLGEMAPRYPAFTFFCASPLILSLGWFFLAPGLRSAVFALTAAFLSSFVWWRGGLLLESWELPVLTFPYAITCTAMLAFLRFAPRSLRPFLPELVPLHRVGEESARRLGPSRAAGRRYWTMVEKLAKAGVDGVPERRIDAAVACIATAERIAVLTGAGLSTEAGIPDYRSGIIDWQVYDPEELSWSRFVADENARRTYWRMSQDFYVILREAQPARGHRALARLERSGKLLGIVTQNVDRLHQRAGSSAEKVVEIHGHEFGVTCLNCGARYSRDEIHRWILHGTDVPYCLFCPGGFLKPDSIAFGQPMPFDASRRALEIVDRADLLLVTGTSLLVEPVASLVARSRARGARLVIINLQPTDFDPVADVVLRGSAGAILDRLVDRYEKLRSWVDV